MSGAQDHDRSSTRWQIARARSRGFSARREAVSLLAGGVFGALALLVFVSPDTAVQELIVVAGAALGAAGLVPAGELFWNWIVVPRWLMEDDLRQLREEVTQLQKVLADGPKKREAPVNVRLTLLNLIRLGEDLRGTNLGPYIASAPVARWTDSAVETLNTHVGEDAAERLLRASEGAAPPGDQLDGRVEVLREIVGELEQTS